MAISADADRAFSEALRQHQAGRLVEAERAYRRILESFPTHADSLHLLGVIGLQTGNLEPAVSLIQQAIELRPDGAIYRSNLGQVLEQLGRVEEAEESYRAAIAIDPACAEACNNLGRLCQRDDRLDEAESRYRQAIDSSPDYAEPHANIGNLRKDRGDLDGAIRAFRRAIELRPDLSMLHSNLLLTLHYHPDFSMADLAREHRLWARRHVLPLAPEHRPHANDPDPDRRLKIGYVSPDFREHAVARFMLPLLANHDRRQVELFAYAGVSEPDATSDRLRAQFDHWRDIAKLSDQQVATAVREDRIDILVDLAAHSGNNRLLAFARKPAPVQMTYLAYCSTTGVDAIDYRLTDRYLDPNPADESNYAERSIHLPHCYWCYAAPATKSDDAPTCERRPGPPTFACLNNFAKVSAATLRLWTRLMQRVPEARLLIYARSASHRDRVREAFEAASLATERLEFVGWQSLDRYLETYRRVDVALDPVPFAGGTTTCDALWMGVPVVTMAGQTPVARGGATLLSNAGLPDLIARTEAEYVDIAAALIGDPQRLARLRGDLRSTLEASPVMDASQFARDIESVFRNVWRQWCEGRAPGT